MEEITDQGNITLVLIKGWLEPHQEVQHFCLMNGTLETHQEVSMLANKSQIGDSRRSLAYLLFINKLEHHHGDYHVC